MATFVTTQTVKKPKRASQLSDTIGHIYVKTFSFTIPSTAANVDSAELTSVKIPANTTVLAAWTKANANGPANSAISLKYTTRGTIIFNAANNVTDYWLSQTITAANAYTTTDGDTLTVTQTGAANATGEKVVQAALLLVSLDGDAAPYSTFTI